jgi:hypothetical protein
MKLFYSLSLFIFVFLSQYLIIDFYGVNIPYMDQWDAEAELYIRYLNNTLSLSFLIEPHNEHRILLTRIFNLVLFILNDGWNPKLNMHFQSILVSLISLLLYKFLTKSSKDKIYLFCQWLIILSAFSSFYYFENILWSFQNQFYWMLLLLLLVFIIYQSQLNTFKLSLICLLAFLGIFTIASGVLISLFSLIILTYFNFTNRIRKKYKLFIYILVLITLIGFLFQVKVEEHSILKSHDFSEFITGILIILGWPNAYFNFLFIPVTLLFMLSNFRFLGRIFYSKSLFINKKELLILFLLGWVLLQILSISYGRARAGVLSSRYLITYSLLLPVLFYFVYFNSKLNLFKIYSILCSIIISVNFIIYSFQYSIPEIELHQLKLTLWKKNLILAYKKNDIQFIKKRNKIHPRIYKVWRVLQNKELKDKQNWLHRD